MQDKLARPADVASSSSARPRAYSEQEYNFLWQHYKPNEPQADGPLPADRLGKLATFTKNNTSDQKMWPVIKDVIYGNASAVEQRLDTGRLNADATFYMEYPLNNLQSLLDTAIKAGQRSVINVLLNHGASVNQREVYGPNGESVPVESPLTIAARAGEDDVVQLLLSHGADVEQLSGFQHNSDTALHAAVYSGNVSTAYVLLTHGANIDSALGPGGTVPPILVQFDQSSPRNIELRNLLVDYGAKMPTG